MLSSPASDARASGAWGAPLVSTIVTVPLALLLFALAGISAMACDSCESAVSHRFDQSLMQSVAELLIGSAVAGVLLVAAWVLPWRQRNAVRRVVFAWLAPCVVGLSFVVFLVFLGMVNWP
ncbi:hypothetical protein ADK70_03885 [Streptomyces rimosus subsp. pseudoverticillatus]|nr:hypothetical protein ADK70_03885 [Streptomyces rimosus subsp. pseudoverticillatus]